MATASAPELKLSAAPRLVSLDAFRGVTIALMVLVNTPGDWNHVYAPLQHAEWHGWTLTDTVFPSFLWIAGVAITLSLARRMASGAPRKKLIFQALRRAAILYALGVFMYAFPHFETLRILGVLQRIAICYFAAVVIYLFTKPRGQIAWIVSLLAGCWLLMMLVPVPGYGAGRLDIEGNLAHWVDRVVLGPYNYKPTATWDPEGIVSTLPAIATTLLGIMAGHILRLRRALSERTVWLFFVGILLLALGLVCNNWLPINKKLWTSSFALFMGGLDFVVFGIFLWWCDGLGRQRLVKPFVILGMNAITVYMASEVCIEALSALPGPGGVPLRDWLYQTVFAPLASPINASLIWGTAYTAVMWLFAFLLYRRRWFIRV